MQSWFFGSGITAVTESQSLFKGPAQSCLLSRRSNEGFWAISSGAFYRFGVDGAKKDEYRLPKLTPVSGIYLSRELPGVIVLRTDANWAVSVSGYTPLVIPLEESATPVEPAH
jgi:hypothetical protein